MQAVHSPRATKLILLLVLGARLRLIPSSQRAFAGTIDPKTEGSVAHVDVDHVRVISAVGRAEDDRECHWTGEGGGRPGTFCVGHVQTIS